jgi:uncharacterized protein
MGLGSEAIAEIQRYQAQSAALLLYQSVLTSEVGLAWSHLLAALIDAEPLACTRAYGRWFSALAEAQQSWPTHLITQILWSDNAFSRQVQALKLSKTTSEEAAEESLQLSNVTGFLPPSYGLTEYLAAALVDAVRHDLAILQDLRQLSPQQLRDWHQQLCGGPPLPVMDLGFEPVLPFGAQPDWAAAWSELAAYYRMQGVGIVAQYAALRWQRRGTGSNPSGMAAGDGVALAGGAKVALSNPLRDPWMGQLVGIPSPDPVRLSQLVAYEHPKQLLIQNTESLLRGRTAQNVLLYGSRGAGKSSLVKALLNEYRDRGLRLIEVAKADLFCLPQIVEPLGRAAQKFIIFVDDLSFEEDDEAFKALKVVLEGGVTARPQNVVVYATSNRRHLIREFFDERPKPKDAEEIQAWDTVQEKLSFSDRFGLTLTFTPADQPTYLAIVRELATQAGLNIDTEHLEWRARQWATRHNGRSGRTARQFIDFLIAEQDDEV